MTEPWTPQTVTPELQQELAQLFPDLSFEEALQHQESLYQSLNISNVRQTTVGPSLNEASSSSSSNSVGQSQGEPSMLYIDEYDLDLDEALARSLEMLDMEYLARLPYMETVTTTPGSSANANANARQVAESTPTRAIRRDEINPDELSYEELQSLGESLGAESKGLLQSEISSLPTRILKTDFFWRKVNTGECAICFSGYKNKQSITTLPCAHQYHSKCINEWLYKSKTCPVCKKEVVPS
ncbi:hypothetical protein vseg_001236 [Gypsophila vaccaria]